MDQQLLGEEIKVYMKDSVIDYAHVINQAFSIEDLHEKDLFNQVSSKEMFAFFDNGDIRESRAVDNVLVVYYPMDDADSSYIGMVSMETSEMRMFMENKKLQRIWTPKTEGVVYPMTQVPPNKRYLPDFLWFDYVRPTSKEDIFEWRGKRAGTELKPQKRREAPVQRIPVKNTETVPDKQQTTSSEQKEEETLPQNDEKTTGDVPGKSEAKEPEEDEKAAPVQP
jgi:hypothetical protein